MTDTLPTMTDADLIITLRSPHYDSWVCRLAATRMEELGVGLFLKGLTMPDRDVLAEVEELSIRDVLAEVEETLAGWRWYEDAELPVPRNSPAANADEPEWLRDKLRVLVTRCRETEAKRDHLQAEFEAVINAVEYPDGAKPTIVCKPAQEVEEAIIRWRSERNHLRAENKKLDEDLRQCRKTREEALVIVIEQRDRLKAELSRLRESIGVCGDAVSGPGDIADYIALRNRGDVLQSEIDQLAVGNLEAQHRGAIEGTRLKAELVLVTDTLREAIEDCADQRRRAERLEAKLAQHEQDSRAKEGGTWT